MVEKIAHSLEEVEELQKQGWRLVKETYKMVYIMEKEEEISDEELAELHREEEERLRAEGMKIVDVKEVPPEEVRELVRQGWEVSTRYKGLVQLVLRKKDTEEWGKA